MKTLLLTILLVLVSTSNILTDQPDTEGCFVRSQSFYHAARAALTQNSIQAIIDSLQKVVEEVPSIMRACGAEEEAKSFETAYPPACTRVLAKEAKLLVKIMRLYAEDQEKNEKQIMVYTAMFETVYKMQVQKKCPFLADHPLMEVKNKGECAEGAYRLSLAFETLDNDLMAGKLNASLTDMGKVVQQLPLALDSCSQHKLASMVRKDFPEECLKAIGGLVRETASLEHHYAHYEWLHKHFKEFLKTVTQVRVTCPALEH